MIYLYLFLKEYVIDLFGKEKYNICKVCFFIVSFLLSSVDSNLLPGSENILKLLALVCSCVLKKWLLLTDVYVSECHISWIMWGLNSATLPFYGHLLSTVDSIF